MDQENPQNFVTKFLNKNLNENSQIFEEETTQHIEVEITPVAIPGSSNVDTNFGSNQYLERKVVEFD